MFGRYTYVGNDPMNGIDPTGEVLETVWDAANVVIGVASLGSNLKNGNFGAAGVDAVGVVIDAAATVVPFVPGGAGTAIKLGRAANKVSDALQANKVTDAARAATCCFVAGTLVETKDGLQPIEKLEIGDLVLARDTNTGETQLKPVTDLIRRHDRVIWEVSLSGVNGEAELFETTDDHPWWIAGIGWTTTEQLTPNMSVITANGRGMVITLIIKTTRTDATYNITVADFETYFVGKQQVLVHNCKNKLTKQQRKQQVRAQRKEARENEPMSDKRMDYEKQGLTKDQQRQMHDKKQSGEGDRSERQVKEDRQDVEGGN